MLIHLDSAHIILQAYVACALGIGDVSYTVIVFGIVGAVVSIALDPVCKRIGRLPIFITGNLLLSVKIKILWKGVCSFAIYQMLII